MTCDTHSYLQNFVFLAACDGCEDTLLVEYTCDTYSSSATGPMLWEECASLSTEYIPVDSLSRLSSLHVVCVPGSSLTGVQGVIDQNNDDLTLTLSYRCCSSSVLYSAVFTGNSALEGSVFHTGSSRSYYSVQASSDSNPVAGFVDNLSHRGSVVSVKDMFENDDDFIFRTVFPADVYWRNNTGPDYASQNVYVVPIAAQILVRTYYQNLDPSPAVHMLDFFGGVNTSDSTSVVTATVRDFDCMGKFAYLSGPSSIVASSGVALFDQLAAFCFPGGNMTLRITTQPEGMDSSFALTTDLQLSFRECVDGEVLEDNQCRKWYAHEFCKYITYYLLSLHCSIHLVCLLFYIYIMTV